MGRILFGTRAALGAALAFVVSAPALAAESTTTASAGVQLRWTVQAVGSIAVMPRSTTTDSAVGATEDAASRCGTVSSAADGSSALVTFARIVPDGSRAAACFAPGAVAVQVATNARGWHLFQTLAAGAPPGLALCALASGTASRAAALAAGGGSACPSGSALGTSPLAVSSGAGATSAPVVEDLGLIFAPNAPTSATLRLDFTLTYD